jgi:hypothetical protein
MSPQSKIWYLYLVIVVEKEILGLNVSMSDFGVIMDFINDSLL